MLQQSMSHILLVWEKNYLAKKPQCPPVHEFRKRLDQIHFNLWLYQKVILLSSVIPFNICKHFKEYYEVNKTQYLAWMNDIDTQICVLTRPSFNLQLLSYL